MKLYFVNEKPDGSGRWHDIFSQSWVMSVENATTFTDREEVNMVASDCAGHVVEFTVGGVEPEPDAIMVCHVDGSPHWHDVLPFPLDTEDWERVEFHHRTTRKVYLDTPPPAPAVPWRDELCAALGWQSVPVQAAIAEVKRLKEVLDNREALELHEVSRLSKVLDEARRKTESVRVAAREIQRERDELSKQEPVAWRSPFDCDNGWVWTSNSDVAEEWRRCGEVEPLYAAPKPAEEPGAIETAGFAWRYRKNGMMNCMIYDSPSQARERCHSATDNTHDLVRLCVAPECRGQIPTRLPWGGRAPKIDARGAHRRAKQRAEAAVAAVHWQRSRKAAPADTPAVDLTAKYAAWEAGERTPDTPAMVEARRLLAEGWEPLVTGNPWRIRYAPDAGRADIFVAPSVADAMRALRGGK